MILLFDIDGTLVSTGGAGRRAYRAAFAERFGAGHDLLDFSFSGRTDPMLVRRGVEAAGRDFDDELFDDLVERYLKHLRRELDDPSDYTVHPGVDDLLRALGDRPDLALGLGTGNLERGARLKLEPAGLNDYFAFGGFGSDAEDRAELLAAGARRGADHLDEDLDSQRIVVVGDTARDVRAARRLGADVLAVDTGSYDPAEIREADPDRFVDDLRDESVRDFLLRTDRVSS